MGRAAGWNTDVTVRPVELATLAAGTRRRNTAALGRGPDVCVAAAGGRVVVGVLGDADLAKAVPVPVVRAGGTATKQMRYVSRAVL